MGIIICQTCDRIIEHIEYEKVTTLYGKCSEYCAKPCKEPENLIVSNIGK